MVSHSYLGVEIPTVSVWIITYNHEAFIRQCLESVLQQKTNFNFDVIIGEDCSTDLTRDIIREFELLYPQIIKPIYLKKNVGAYRNAYEFCYPQLTGKYIACLEADDYWTDQNKLQMQVDALENNLDAVLCFTQVKVLRNNQFEAHWSESYNIKQRYSLEDILITFNIVTCTLLFRNLYSELPYNPFDYPTGDVSLSAFLLLNGNAIYIDQITAVYRLHEKGIYSPQNLEKKNLVFLKIFEQLIKEPLFEKYYKLLTTLLADRAYQAFCFEIKKENVDWEIAKGYANKAVKQMSFRNLFFPFKTIFRAALYLVTGKSFGRDLN